MILRQGEQKFEPNYPKDYNFQKLRKIGVRPNEAKLAHDVFLFTGGSESVNLEQVQKAVGLPWVREEKARKVLEEFTRHINKKLQEQHRYAEELPNKTLLQKEFETRRGYNGPRLRDIFSHWLSHHHPGKDTYVNKFMLNHLGKLLFHLGSPNPQFASHYILEPQDTGWLAKRKRRDGLEKFFDLPLKKVAPRIRSFFKRYCEAVEYYEANKNRF